MDLDEGVEAVELLFRWGFVAPLRIAALRAPVPDLFLLQGPCARPHFLDTCGVPLHFDRRGRAGATPGEPLAPRGRNLQGCRTGGGKTMKHTPVPDVMSHRYR